MLATPIREGGARGGDASSAKRRCACVQSDIEVALTAADNKH